MNTLIDKQELINLIDEYLSSGGLFNPELMDHDKVRSLLIDCRKYLITLNTATNN